MKAALKGFSKFLLATLLANPNLHAQEETATETGNANAVLDRTPWISARGAGMGGALSPLADHYDAPVYNPAGIGGLDSPRDKKFFRTLHFPFIGVAANENSVKLFKEFKSEGALSDPAVADAILDANEGERQYVRYSLVPKVELGRLMLAYNYDAQLAAVSKGQGTDLIETHYRLTQGPAAGLSVSNASGTLYFGVFSFLATRKDTEADFAFGEINDPQTRKGAFDGNAVTRRGTSNNVGMIWQISKKASPTLALVAKDLGGTKYTGGGTTITEKEDLTLGFSVSPELGKWGVFSWVVEGSRLGDDELSIQKKLRTGTEFTFGSITGSRAALALRAGYNNAGVSYGAGCNLGLIGLQFGSFVEDIGINNERVVERRTMGILTINVAD